MSYCSNCGTLISDEWKFCPRCGAKKRPDICPSCGRQLRDEWLFCPQCGTPAGGADTDKASALFETSGESEVLPEPPENEPEPEAEPEAESKSEPEAESKYEAEDAVPEADETFEIPDTTEPEAEDELPPVKELFYEQDEPEQSAEEHEYAGLIVQRDAIREELKLLDERSAELNRTGDEFLKLPPEERSRISEERRRIRTGQGRCHSRLLQISGRLRQLAEQEARRGREIYSREHPEVVCPACSAKLRRGVDTWPLCPFCGENVTEPGHAGSNTVLLKLRCGEAGIKRVWYTGDRDFFEYWEAYHNRHRKHEYHYSAGRVVLTAEDAESRGEGVASEMPDELYAMHTLLHRERAAETGEDNAGGMQTVNMGTLDMTDLNEAERLAFLRLLLVDRPNRDRRKFKLE